MIIFVICIIAAAVGAVAMLCVLSRRSSEEARYKGAAANIYRDKLLKWSLMNPYQSAENVLSADDSLFVYIKNARSKGKHQYVFCVGDKVYIGRGRNDNQLILSDPLVSEKHCLIYAENGTACIYDLNSGNGTVIKRGRFDKGFMLSGSSCVLEDNDEIILGESCLKIKIFKVEADLFDQR